MNRTWIPRLLGVATAAYGAAVVVDPDLFLGPTGLADSAADGGGSTGKPTLARAIGGRDLASGIAMAVAPAGNPLRTAIAVGVGADVVDLVALGSGLPDQESREKATLVAAGWGALCALSLLAAGRPTPRLFGRK